MQRRPRLEIPALLALANGAPCANCGRDDGTTVAAHANTGATGKGLSKKSDDCCVAFLCYWCHTWLDQCAQTRDTTGRFSASPLDKREMWTRAHIETFRRLWREGQIVVRGKT